MCIIPQKLCSKCKQSFPATTEYFRKASKEKSGLTSRCKSCLHEGDALYRENNPEHGKQWWEEHKEEINAERRAEYETNPEPLRKKGRDYYAQHPEEAKKRVKAYRENNPEKIKEQNAKKHLKLRNDPERWAEKLEQTRLYYEQFPERKRLTARKSNEKHKDKKRDYRREYEKRFPEKMRAKSHKRMAMKKQAGGSYTAEDLQRLYEEQDGRCGYCGQSIYWHIKRDIHIDHIQPLTKGGSNNPDNLRLTCHYCNESKGDKLLADWLLVRGW